MGGNTIPITGGSSGVGRELAKPAGDPHDAALCWSARFLVALSRVSGAIFVAYIIAFFVGVAAGCSDGARPSRTCTMAARR